MQPNNQFSKSQLNVLAQSGFRVYDNPANEMLQLVKHSTSIPALLVQLDYRNNTLLIINQNIYDAHNPHQPLYNQSLPNTITQTIQILNQCQAITIHQKERLHINRY